MYLNGMSYDMFHDWWLFVKYGISQKHMPWDIANIYIYIYNTWILNKMFTLNECVDDIYIVYST